jgi:flagellar biosynthesis protein FlhF
MGMLPRFVQKVVDRAQLPQGHQRPETLAEELHLARMALRQAWPSVVPPSSAPAPQAHVLVGPPGVGKTTCLCKWLAQSVLLENQPARVWRLNGATANTADFLSVFCEILGVTLERSPLPEEAIKDGLLLVDMPGVNWRDASALKALADQIAPLPAPQVHLVLNAAYEMSTLFAQARAFGSLPVADLSFTHLDEEGRWGKLWNFVFGTNYTLRFFSAGQNIPGDFFAASAERLLAQQFA